MQTMKKIHVMHMVPAMSVGLTAMLRASGWTISRHGEQAEGQVDADVVIADYDTGLSLLRGDAYARRQDVLIVTHRDTETDLRHALELGVAGYLGEDAGAAQLAHAVQCVLTGMRYLCPRVRKHVEDRASLERLTNRESEVLQLLAKGYCNKMIARSLGIGVGTVKYHVRGVMGKLQVTARTHAVVVAAQRGLVGFGRTALD